MFKKEKRFFEEEEIRGANLQLVYDCISTVAPSSINPKGHFRPLIKYVPKLVPL
jgi:hypothetical protein